MTALLTLHAVGAIALRAVSLRVPANAASCAVDAEEVRSAVGTAVQYTMSQTLCVRASASVFRCSES